MGPVEVLQDGDGVPPPKLKSKPPSRTTYAVGKKKSFLRITGVSSSRSVTWIVTVAVAVLVVSSNLQVKSLAQVGVQKEEILL